MKNFKLFLLLLPSFIFAQDFSANWKDLYSYYQIRDIAYANGKVYAAAENAVFSYQIGSGATEKISSINGLSGEFISEIYYSSEHDALVIGYENGLMEIVQEDEEVLSVIDILEKQTIAPDEKIINHFYEHEDKIYISTGYGISVYDLENFEFGETFFIGPNGSQLNVSQTTVLGDQIYAATSQGIRHADLNNPNLIDYSNWNVANSGNWIGVVSFQNEIYAASQNNSLHKMQGNTFVLARQFNQIIRDLRASEEMLTLTTTHRVHIFNAQFTEVITIDNLVNETIQLSSAQYFANRVFLGDKRLGLLKVMASSTSQFETVSPNGPLMNRVFDMTAAHDKLWVVYGEYDSSFNPYPITKRGLSRLMGETWINTPFEELQAAELSDVAIDPNDPNRVFVSSYYDGLLEFQNGELVKIYDENNSGLEDISEADPDASPGDVRIDGIDFDRRGNLYLTNGLVEHPLKKLTPGGTIQNIDVSDAFLDPLDGGVGELIVGSAGNVFMATHKSGIIAYRPSSDIAKSIDRNLEGVDFPEYASISSLTLDQNNRLWIGTNRGLRVMYNPAGIFQENPNVSVQPIIFMEGDVAQELLYRQSVTDIAVDGANNKWISTVDAGIFYVSENGQETLYHFTTENSPLPSNNVNSVEIDAVSGKVYIGTINGLVAFQGAVIQGEESLANVYVYPNPVRPGYNGLVTIAKLTENANVKITDITGNLVYEVVSEGGSVQWDTRAFGKHKVASGVYLVLITGEDALETKVTKIMIVR